MQKSRSSNCLLYSLLGCGFFSLCVCLPAFLGTVWFGKELSNAINATPTPITTCRGMMDNMQIPKSVPTVYRTIPLQDLVTYSVSGDQISDPDALTVDDALIPLQEDTMAHQTLWRQYVMLIPPEHRKLLTKYKIITDGTNNINAQAYIESKYESMDSVIQENWTLEVDPADFSTAESFTPNLLHEFGHFVTLRTSQINYIQKENTCSQYWTDGCSLPSSYLQIFYDRFWASMYADWKAMEATGTPEEVKLGLSKYYDAHPKEFVSLYALTNPKEDIAESWTHYILSPKPKGESLAEKKILYFYEYPELIQLRTSIIGRLCEHYNFPPPDEDSGQ
jgi:hypothetical protein